MFLNSFLMIVVAFCSGVGVAAGTFAFLLIIRVIPRMIQKARLEEKIIYIENKVVQGVLFGTVLSFFVWKKRWLFELLGRMLLTIYGISAGVFSGCVAVALAEILDTFPVLFKRAKLDGGHVEEFLKIVLKLLSVVHKWDIQIIPDKLTEMYNK